MKKIYVIISVAILILTIIAILCFTDIFRKSSYEIIGSNDKNEYKQAQEKCEEALKYLENKYNEKFHITCSWSYIELSRISSMTAYSYKNPDKTFSIWESYGFNDSYIDKLVEEEVFAYFYNIISKYDINKKDFSVNYVGINDLNINKKSLGEADVFSFEIYIYDTEFTKFEKNLPQIARELNNSVSTNDTSDTSLEPNFIIELYTKSNNSYVNISIYDHHYYAFQTPGFPDNLFKNIHTKIEF